jgi:hypothetical protein
MLEHVLPEGEIGQESNKMILKVFAEEALGLWVWLHLAIVGEQEYDWKILWWMQHRQFSGRY